MVAGLLLFETEGREKLSEDVFAIAAVSANTAADVMRKSFSSRWADNTSEWMID